MAKDEKQRANEQEAQQAHAERTVVSAPSAVSFDQALEDWEQEMGEVFEATRAAEQLSAEDFAVRINAKA